MSHRLSIFAFLAIGLSSQGFAACLLGSYSVEDEFDRSAIVAVGTVVSSEAVEESLPHYDGTNYTVNLTSIYRGPETASVTIFSENSTGRFPMEIEREYILFIHDEFGRYYVDNCGNSGPSIDKEAVIETVRSIAQDPA
jgi:hypothetical protein